MARPFKWDLLAFRAALILGTQAGTHEQLKREAAAAVPCSVRTIERWLRNAEFQAQVAEVRAELTRRLAEEATDESLATYSRRMQVLDDLDRKLEEVIKDRAETTPEHLPGAATGLVRLIRTKTTKGDWEEEEETVVLDPSTVTLRQGLVATAHRMAMDMQGGPVTDIPLIEDD